MNGGGMEVRITSRHTTLSEPFRARTKELLSRLNKYGAPVPVIEVVFDEEKNTKKVKAILHVDLSAPKVATGAGRKFSEALSQVNDRLARRPRKLQKQVKDHRALPMDKAFSEE
jgi:ribosomal subunit interface protein